jgi:LysR family cyn operon transcriptional activator
MPLTRLVLVNRATDAIAEQVLRGDLDLGIVTLPTSREELEERELFHERLVLVLPANHRLSARKRVRLAELEREALLLLHSGTRTGSLLREYFRGNGFEPQVVLDSGSFEVIKRYVAQGVGSAFLPEVVLTSHDRGLARARVPGLPAVRIGAIWRRGAYQTRAQLAFMRLVEEHRLPANR